MNPFEYQRADKTEAAVEAMSRSKDARFLAGGTNLIDLMKNGVEQPTRLIDINRLSSLAEIHPLPDGGLRLGALARNADTANHPLVRKNYPLLAQALLAGASAQLVAKEGQYAQVRMPSGEVRRIDVRCSATIGQVGNTDHENTSVGKAGRNRWKGIRPSNRGVSMNPVDHPHGGGEGKTSGGRHPVTPWGQPTRGYKTRNNKRTDVFIVKRRSK